METIIVQDTDAGILDVLVQTLEMENFKVYAFKEFDLNFMAIIDQVQPHAILLDFLFNGETSTEVCKAVKNKYPNLPVIALSCNTNIDKVAPALGFDDYIKKPFDISLVYQILRKHISDQPLLVQP